MISYDINDGFSPINSNYVERLVNNVDVLRSLVKNINSKFFFIKKCINLIFLIKVIF